jgi:alkylation response protein AidB-like acyl-CoA dehydrogenase
MASTAEDLSSERDMFRDTVRRYVETELMPHAEEWEEAEGYPREVWNQLGEAGLLCVDMPEEYGGLGGDFPMSAVVLEELSRAGLAGLATGVSVHSDIVAPYVLHIGSDEQKQKWLPKMASGEVVGAIAMTEPGAGSDLQNIRSNAKKDGDQWVLNGAKTFITNGIYAGMVIVAAKTTPDGGSKGTSLFTVDTSLEGFRTGRNLRKLGQHSNDTAELFFEDVRLEADAMLGTENRGFMHLMDELPRERIALSIGAVAAAEGVIEKTLEYARERKAFGQSLGQFQNTRFKMAEMKTDLEMARALVQQGTQDYLNGQLTPTRAAMIKLGSTEMQCRVADGCLQIFGGYGYMREYPVARAFADARIQRIYGGTSEIMKELVAREMLGR